jgi:hypothetical protein
VLDGLTFMFDCADLLLQVYYSDRLTFKCCNKVSQLDNM